MYTYKNSHNNSEIFYIHTNDSAQRVDTAMLNWQWEVLLMGECEIGKRATKMECDKMRIFSEARWHNTRYQMMVVLGIFKAEKFA